MKYVDLTFDDPAANLACDQALLELHESDGANDALLRTWEPRNHFVVLGRSNRLSSEVSVSACAQQRVSILRRLSGGGAVMQGPGCLNYSLILNNQTNGFKNINETFHYVLARHCHVIEQLAGAGVRIEGISDLTFRRRKFSGNAQYTKARYVLVHGTFLLNFDLSMIAKFLRMPAKQPDYRRQRAHLEFVTNLNLNSAQVRDSLRMSWNALEEFSAVPWDRIDALVAELYGRGEWSTLF